MAWVLTGGAIPVARATPQRQLPSETKRVHPSELPPTEVKRNLMKLWRQMRAFEGGGTLVGRLLDNGVRAGQRSRSARDAGDRRHARLLEWLAEDWALLAQRLLRAVRVERENKELAKRLRVKETSMSRRRALVAALHARRGRLRAAIAGSNKTLLLPPSEGAK